MGCLHILCRKCKVGFDLENGMASMTSLFIRQHWHSKKKIPFGEGSLPLNLRNLPYYMELRKRIPDGYISVRVPVFSETEDYSLSFKREDLEEHIRLGNEFWTLWKKAKYYLGSIFGAIKGEYYKLLLSDEPFVVDKDNEEHNWIISFRDLHTDNFEEVEIEGGNDGKI